MRRSISLLTLLLFAGGVLAITLRGDPVTVARAEEKGTVAQLTTPLVDNYGYTAELAAWEWEDISDGIPVTFGDDTDDAYVNPTPYVTPFVFPIGFYFPFYENSYSQLRISTNGYLTLDVGVSEQLPRNLDLPSDQKPNNIIAPFWDDLIKGSGNIYYANGTRDGLDFFAVQWDSFSRFNTTDPLTFQVLLFKNGDILFQYEEMTGEVADLLGASVGIEDRDGVDGISYLFNGVGVPVSSYSAIYFTRPGASRRAKLTPLYAGGFIVAGKASFDTTLTNIGNMTDGDLWDSYVLSSSIETQSIPGWQVSYLFDTLPVTNSGPLAQLASRVFQVVVTPPTGATVGDHALIRLKATSTHDPLKSATVSVQVAVPSKFMHAYADFQGMHLGRYWKENVTSTPYASFDQNVALAPAGENYVMVWDFQEGDASNLKYVVVNKLGVPDLYVSPLENNNSTFDWFPSLASGLGENHQVAVVWPRQWPEDPDNLLFDPVYNLMLAVLNPDLDIPLVIPPKQLTQNTLPHSYYGGGVEIHDANGFWVGADKVWIVWKEKRYLDLQETTTDIRAGLYNLTSMSWHEDRLPFLLATGNTEAFYSDLTLTGLEDGTVLVFFTGEILDQKTQQIHWAALGTGGLVEISQIELGLLQGSSLDAAILTDKVMLAWVAPDRGSVHYSLFSINDNVSPFTLEPVVTQSLVLQNLNLVENVSLFADQQYNGILTWKNVDDTQMYYALVDSSGALLTPAVMFFRDPYARAMVSKNGQSSTTYTGAYPLSLPLIRK